TKNPLRKIPTAHQAIAIAKETKTPLHPEYTAYWKLITPEQLKELLHWLDEAKIHTTERGVEKIILPIRQAKKTLEDAGIEHSVANSEFVIITNPWATVLEKIFCLTQNKPSELAAKMQGEDALEKINSISEIKQRDKAGTFIGTRMGRPEKAKQRELTGSPHVIFPVGEEGGRLRSFQSALAARKVTSTFPFFYCKKCDNKTVFRKCELCDIKTTQLYNCKRCGLLPKKECDEHGPCDSCDTREIDINKYFESTLKKMGLKQYPDLIKGVRGTVNSEHIPEHIAKGIFRARYGVHVYKDGTTRYDMTQLPMTHFKPCEIGVSIEKLKELGYKKDINGKELERENQILEIKPQDIVLPNPPESPDSGAAEVLANVAKFVDDTLEHHYGLERFYNIKNPKDLIGHLTIALAPHTSAGIVSRIIGFSKTQGLLAHPLLHAITRRDCDGDEACVILLLDAFLNFSKKYLPSSRGSTMDTPLVLTSILTPTEVDDMAFDVDIEWKYPLELYQAALEYKAPWDVKINQIQAHLGKPTQYEQMGFTHDNGNINMTVACSAYKTLPSMQEKLEGQMDLAVKLRSVNESDVAQLVIEKHFLKDTKGNLRKFSQQMFRCVKCNEKFRRPPLAGKCTACSGKIIFTISEGSVVKYLQPTIDLAEKYNVTPYLKQVIELLRLRVEGVFGKDPEKQLALGDWF
ncbi:DNA polymerase II large subunit, partial [Candidatus Woesearchaeota archaeon]